MRSRAHVSAASLVSSCWETEYGSKGDSCESESGRGMSRL